MLDLLPDGKSTKECCCVSRINTTSFLKYRYFEYPERIDILRVGNNIVGFYDR